MKSKLARYALPLLLFIIGGSSCTRTCSGHNYHEQRPDDRTSTTDRLAKLVALEGCFRYEDEITYHLAPSQAYPENAHAKDRVSIPRIFNHSLLGLTDKSAGKTPAQLDQASKFPKIFKFVPWKSVTVEEPNGEIIVYEKSKKGDCLLTPIGSSIWNWKEGPSPHTSHSTGIQKKHIESLVDQADIFILSRGVTRSLKINEETEAFLLNKGKIVYFLQSEEAAKKYTELTNKGLKVVALIHITC